MEHPVQKPRTDDFILRIASSTNVCDLSEPVRAYIRNLRPRGSTVGSMEVWTRKRRGGPSPRFVAVGPTRESVSDYVLQKSSDKA